MNVTKKILPQSQVSLSIVLTPEDWKKYEIQAMKRVQAAFKVDGFRKGHVPENIIRQRIGTEGLQSETVEIALPQAYTDAVRQEKINPIGEPNVKIEGMEPFSFSVTVDIYPEVQVGKIDPKKVKKGENAVSQSEVDDMVKTLQMQFSEKMPVSRAAKNGDIVEFDFDGTDLEGNPQPGMKSTHHPLELGTNTFIPGFEEELLGLSSGDEKTFEITFPKDYHHSTYAGKPFRFTVTVHEVLEKTLPEMNEELVEKITGTKKSVEDLKTEIEEHLKDKKEMEDWKVRQQEFFEMIGKATKAEVPEVFITDELGGLIDEIKLQGLQAGMPWEQYLANMKKTEDDLKKELRKDAESTVLSRLGLQKLLEENNITVEEKDVLEEVSFTIARLPKPEQEKRAKHYRKGHSGWTEVENRLKIRKFFKEQLHS
ncbi:MAG: trigger factor [Candidatus Peregrinibacteria bacterium]